MEKIFKVRMKFFFWHIGTLKFAGVGKFLSWVPPLEFFENNFLIIKSLWKASWILIYVIFLDHLDEHYSFQAQQQLSRERRGTNRERPRLVN